MDSISARSSTTHFKPRSTRYSLSGCPCTRSPRPSSGKNQASPNGSASPSHPWPITASSNPKRVVLKDPVAALAVVAAPSPPLLNRTHHLIIHPLPLQLLLRENRQSRYSGEVIRNLSSTADARYNLSRRRERLRSRGPSGPKASGVRDPIEKSLQPRRRSVGPGHPPYPIRSAPPIG